MTESEEDPLKHADVGETATVQDTAEIHTFDLEPNEFRGSDRFGRAEIVDTEIKTDEYGDEVLEVTVEGEITKQLPRRWDYCREPRTESERKQARRRSILKRSVQSIVFFGPLLVSMYITHHIMNRLGGAEIDGATIQSPGIEFFGAIFLMIVLIAGGIQYLPGMAGRPGGRVS